MSDVTLNFTVVRTYHTFFVLFILVQPRHDSRWSCGFLLSEKIIHFCLSDKLDPRRVAEFNLSNRANVSPPTKTQDLARISTIQCNSLHRQNQYTQVISPTKSQIKTITFRLVQNIKEPGYIQAGREFSEFRTSVIFEWNEVMGWKTRIQSNATLTKKFALRVWSSKF